MFDLTETAPPAALPIDASTLALHLRLGEGFGAPTEETQLLETYIRGATAHVERRTGLALVTRSLVLRTTAWSRAGHLALPIGPVAAIASFEITDGATPVALEAGDYVLEPGTQGQRLTGPACGALPAIPGGQRAEIAFDAGFGTAADVPADLVEAVMLLAAHFYEDRTGATPPGLPPAVAALVRPHHTVRI
ncbi:MAG: hypothetical protein AAGC57_06320 [Pseudomonadota bacterium]